MKLGWIRDSSTTATPLSKTALAALIAQADRLGLAQLWLPEFSLDQMKPVPNLQKTRLGIHLGPNSGLSTARLTAIIRTAQNTLGGRFLMGLSDGRSNADRLAFEQVETLTCDHPAAPLDTVMPMAEPRAGVMLFPAANTVPDLRRGACAGFDLLSPAWLGSGDLARHWADIVAGATHARRRARPEQWHLPRLIYVSDDTQAVASYREEMAQRYLSSVCADASEQMADDVVIAGTAAQVAAQVSNLRRCIGPFGTLHVLDPGLSPDETLCQMSRVAAALLLNPQHGLCWTASKELEKT